MLYPILPHIAAKLVELFRGSNNNNKKKIKIKIKNFDILIQLFYKFPFLGIKFEMDSWVTPVTPLTPFEIAARAKSKVKSRLLSSQRSASPQLCVHLPIRSTVEMTLPVINSPIFKPPPRVRNFWLYSLPTRWDIAWSRTND